MKLWLIVRLLDGQKKQRIMKKKKISEATLVDTIANSDYIFTLGNNFSKITSDNARREIQQVFFTNTAYAGTTTYYYKIGAGLNSSVRLYITSVDHNGLRLEAQTLDVIISSQEQNLMKHHVVSKSKININTIAVKYGIVSGEQYLAVTAYASYNKLLIRAENHPYSGKIEKVASINTTGFTEITL